MCPKGDDPLTECVNSDSAQGDSMDMTQKILFPTTGVSSVDAFTSGFYTLTYTDNYGGEWTTYPLQLEDVIDQAHCTAIKTALEELPNFAVPNVTSDLDGSENMCRVTFVDPANSGEQNLLVASKQTDDTNKADMQPRFHNYVATASGVAVEIDIQSVVVSSPDAYKEHVPCSNRGMCDSNNGVCTCFAGYTGESCNIQTVFF
jgi:hypothetical protein